MTERPTAEEEFTAADVVYPINDDAKAEWMIPAKDANGEYAHIRWRRWPDSESPTAEEHEEYWALMTSDEPFEPAELIDAKRKGKKVPTKAPPAPKENVVNLAEVLRKSLEKEGVTAPKKKQAAKGKSKSKAA